MIIKKPKRAKLGIACITLEKPNIGLDNFFTLATIIPRGTPSRTDIRTAITVSSMCSISNVNS